MTVTPTAILSVRVKPETLEKLGKVAKLLGFIYNGKGSIGKMLDAIASLIPDEKC